MMNDTHPQTTAPSARPPNFYGWITTLLLVVPVLGMLYVSTALIYQPIRGEAAIFAALQASPQWIQVEWYGATLIGLYALYAVRKPLLPGLVATLLLAAAYVHLHLALLDNMSIPAWLAVLAAVTALIAALIKRQI
jgi:hypothetical protein